MMEVLEWYNLYFVEGLLFNKEKLGKKGVHRRKNEIYAVVDAKYHNILGQTIRLYMTMREKIIKKYFPYINSCFF